ncbi:GGDEF domain-containing protein [Catenovulum sp. 2E275]|uniref:GGDEF domain-containing protein n=1 Tax=Catenovulum sp. 2E275 TaxID=2980497 RepID=UPI0021D2FD4E|nr:GGDEF domain-containing protein [Catenovulum sp. 2E275]MCU4675950.1 GGDEF domain-containing protein [Catenovulum sp. 2E275]
MQFLLLKRHAKLISFTLGCIFAVISLVLLNGQFKTLSSTDWLDVLGEGGTALMTFIWIFFILASRPPGRVTSLLTIGLTCVFISALIDVLDEFVAYPDHKFWLYWVESLPAFFGMFLMTWALYQWHQEQFKLHAQLNRREAFYREHTQIDYVTQLYSADYMRNQLELLQQDNIQYTLGMVDINNFAQFNHLYSHQDGDRLLREIAEIIVMNLRQSDLACRYAGDRFIILFPHTPLIESELVMAQISKAISYLAFKPQQTGQAVFNHVSYGIVSITQKTTAEAAISQVNQNLERYRSQHAVA